MNKDADFDEDLLDCVLRKSAFVPWFDKLPTEALHINKLYTGTWNEELEYDVYYKTNKSNEYILFKENLNTQIIYELNFKEIELAEDEYITEYEFRFGTVKIGFQEIESPFRFLLK